MNELLGCPPSVEVQESTGRMAIHVPRPGLAVSRIEGHFSSELAKRFEEALDPHIRAGSFVGLHDWTEATTFDVSVPPKLASWTVSHLPRIERIVIATRHPIMSMAVRTTNLTIKRIEHLDSRERWVDVVRGELAKKRTSGHPARRG